MAGTAAEAHLDTALPRPIGAVTDPARVVAIDCAVDGAESWELEQTVFDEVMRDEIAELVRILIQQVAG